MSQEYVPLPIGYQRLNAAPIDATSVFSTTANRTAYLSNASRYAGQVVSDLEDGNVYMVNAARNGFIPVGAVTATNLSLGVSSGNAVRIDSSTGDNVTLPNASATLAGLITNTTQTIAGVKTFTSNVVVPTATADNHALNRITADGRFVTLATNETITGEKRFNSTYTVINSNANNAEGLVFYADNSQAILRKANGSGLTAAAEQTALRLQTDRITFTHTQGVPIMTALNSGNVGIGTTAPSEKLHVVGNALITGNATADTHALNRITADGRYLQSAPATNLSLGVSSGTAVRVDSSTGNNVTLPNASATLAGLITNDSQTISGAKTFTSNVVVPTATADNHALSRLNGDNRYIGKSHLTFTSLAEANEFNRESTLIRATTTANVPFSSVGVGIELKYAATRSSQMWFNISIANTLQYRNSTIADGWLPVRTVSTLESNETITGVKTFSANVTVPNASANNHALNRITADERFVPLTRTITTNNGVSGGGNLTANRTFGLTGQALALHNLGTNGLIARTGAGTVAGRTITAGAGVSVSNGNGVSGNPNVSLSQDFVNQLVLSPGYLHLSEDNAVMINGTSSTLSGNVILRRTGSGTILVEIANGYTQNVTTSVPVTSNVSDLDGGPEIDVMIDAGIPAEYLPLFIDSHLYKSLSGTPTSYTIVLADNIPCIYTRSNSLGISNGTASVTNAQVIIKRLSGTSTIGIRLPNLWSTFNSSAFDPSWSTRASFQFGTNGSNQVRLGTFRGEYPYPIYIQSIGVITP